MLTLWRYVYSLRSASVSVSRCATSLARLAGGSPGWSSATSAGHTRGAKTPSVRMRPMVQSRRGFLAALLIGWVALGVIGIWFARLKAIPGWVAAPALAAILVEYPFYLVPAF